jgi:hypothetical protein
VIVNPRDSTHTYSYSKGVCCEDDFDVEFINWVNYIRVEEFTQNVGSLKTQLNLSHLQRESE